MRLVERRIGLLFGGFLLCFLLIVGRAFWLQGVQGASLASQASYQQTEVVTVPGLRGDLLDRSGNKLAASEDAATIFATPYQVKNPPAAAARLAPILDQPKADVLEALTAEGGFSYLAKKADLGTAAKVKALDIEGIGQLPDSRRAYPQGEMAGQVIGAVGSENEGLTGLEAGEEDVLGGEDGERRIVNDALGEPIRLETVDEAEDGEDVQLTLDPLIQRETERALAGVGEADSPKGATTLVAELAPRQVATWSRRFGFGRPTGIQYPAEEQGLLLDLDEYSGSTLGNEAMGQGLSVTPIQMVAGYTAIANGGMLRSPQLVKQIGDEPVHEPKGKRVISPQNAADIREMLEGVLAPGGTASEVSVPGYTLAGKTGTAEKAEDGGYSETNFVASFIGFAPAANPRLLAAVIVDEPQGEIYGGSVAAPAFGQIAEFALPYLGVPQE